MLNSFCTVVSHPAKSSKYLHGFGWYCLTWGKKMRNGIEFIIWIFFFWFFLFLLQESSWKAQQPKLMIKPEYILKFQDCSLFVLVRICPLTFDMPFRNPKSKCCPNTQNIYTIDVILSHQICVFTCLVLHLLVSNQQRAVSSTLILVFRFFPQWNTW